MPRYHFHLRLGSQVVARDTHGHDCPSDAAAWEFARLSTGLFVLDPFLPSLFGRYCFEVLNEEGTALSEPTREYEWERRGLPAGSVV